MRGTPTVSLPLDATATITRSATSFSSNSVAPMTSRTSGPSLTVHSPGAREKDMLENYLHRQVCSGQMDVRAAQQAISRDWFSSWKQMVTSPH